MDDQACRMNMGRFRVICIRAVVSDVRIGQRDDLLAITGIRQDLLVARVGRIENHLARGETYCSD